MGLYKYNPEPSERMGLLWTLGTIQDAVIIEFGSMGHMVYAGKWFEQTGNKGRSKIYSTHINETDIALGKTERLENAIQEVIQKDKPKAIFIIPSSIPEMIGFDLEAVVKEIDHLCGDTPVIVVPGGGFHLNMNAGIEQGLYTLCKSLTDNCEKSVLPTYNIIGSCVDLYNFQADARELVRIMEGAFGIKPACILTSDTKIGQIKKMGSAHINLVFRYEGIKAAKELENRFGTPYIYQRPYGYAGTKNWLEEIQGILDIKMNQAFVQDEVKEGERLIKYSTQMYRYNWKKARLTVGGHKDIVRGILNYACEELNITKGLCWNKDKRCVGEEIPYWTEEEWDKSINLDLSGILMADNKSLKKAGQNNILKIERNLEDWEFNAYASPFIGFRGAMNLGSIWYNEING